VKNTFKKILCLGGGGARGLISIGILKVLHQEFKKFPFDMIVGSSMGSLIGGCYASGVPLKNLEDLILGFKGKNLLEFGITNTGILNHNCLLKVLNSILNKNDFQNLLVPFSLVTTSLITGKSVVHSGGDLKKLIIASCSVPGIFSAVKYNNDLLVDGGLRNNIPTKIALKLGAEKILAVDPGYSIEKSTPKNVILTCLKALQISEDELNIYQDKIADIVIRPTLRGVNQFNFEKARYIIKCGENETIKLLPKIKELIK